MAKSGQTAAPPAWIYKFGASYPHVLISGIEVLGNVATAIEHAHDQQNLTWVIDQLKAHGAHSISITGVKNGVVTITGVYQEGIGLPFGIGVGQIGPAGAFTLGYNLKTRKISATQLPTTGNPLSGLSGIVPGVSAIGGFFSHLSNVWTEAKAHPWIVILAVVFFVLLLSSVVGLTKSASGGAVPIPVPV